MDFIGKNDDILILALEERFLINTKAKINSQNIMVIRI